jgi:hypothetical protein
MLDQRRFTSKTDAETYKQAARAWAAKNRIGVEVWTEGTCAAWQRRRTPFAQAG